MNNIDLDAAKLATYIGDLLCELEDELAAKLAQDGGGWIRPGMKSVDVEIEGRGVFRVTVEKR